MKIQLACKLHRLPQPSTRHSPGQFSFWLPRQHVDTGLLASGHAGSSHPKQPVSPDTTAA